MQRRGDALNQRVTGYQIHHGRVTGADPWIRLDDAYGAQAEGSVRGRMFGTTLHGLLEEDGFRGAFLRGVCESFVPSGASVAAARDVQLDRLADMLEAHLDLSAIDRLIASAGTGTVPTTTVPTTAVPTTTKEGVPAP
jgi:adenosylcobyric acid synthase